MAVLSQDPEQSREESNENDKHSTLFECPEKMKRA